MHTPIFSLFDIQVLKVLKNHRTSLLLYGVGLLGLCFTNLLQDIEIKQLSKRINALENENNQDKNVENIEETK